MKTYIRFILFTYFFVSCSSIGNNFTQPTYLNSDNYKNFYIVDIIKIDNPVRFYTKSGRELIMSEKNFATYKFTKNDKNLLSCPSAFLYANILPWDNDFPQNIDDKYMTTNSAIYGDDFIKFINNKGVESYVFKKMPDFFLLVFIRADYFNRFYSPLDGAPGIEYKNINMYYKMVIPYSVLNK